MEENKLTPEQVVEEVNALEKKEEAEKLTLTGPVTEVTDLKTEETKTPEQAKKMTAHDYIVQAARDHISGMQYISTHMKELSKKAITRVSVALLKTPEEGSKINFQSELERAIYGVGQRVLNARTTLILSHMQSRIQEDKVKEQEQKPVEQTTSDNKEIENDGSEDTIKQP